MNYRRIYFRLTVRARKRELIGYGERHHVIPRCVGGSDEQRNIVNLTPEEHYVAHQLLVKIYPGNLKLLWAASNMTGKNRWMLRNNKLYGWLRRALSKAMSDREVSKGTREKLSRWASSRTGDKGAMWGKKHSEETRRTMNASKRGIKFSTEHRTKLAAAKKGKKRGPQTPEQIRKRVEATAKSKTAASWAFTKSSAYKRKQSRKSREAWARRKAGALPLFPKSVPAGG